MSNSDQAVIETAKAHQECVEDDIRVLGTGVRVRLRPVSPSLIAEVTARVEFPPVPVFHNPDKGRDEENPNDPRYLADCDAARNAQGMAAMDAMAMFGIELVDPVPDDGWDRKLAFLGIEFDHDDPVAREFYYIKHVAMSMEDFALLQDVSGVTEDGVARAQRSFRRDKRRARHNRAPAEA